jgi:hypothetical protein
MSGAWLKTSPSPYGRNALPLRWRAWGLLACSFSYVFALFAPVKVLWNMDQLVVRGGVLQQTHIDLADLAEVKLLAQLPVIRRRVSGHEIGERKRGTFELAELGTVDLFLDEEDPPYVLLRARGNARSIIVNACEPEESRELFERIVRDVAEGRSRSTQR